MMLNKIRCYKAMILINLNNMKTRNNQKLKSKKPTKTEKLTIGVKSRILNMKRLHGFYKKKQKLITELSPFVL